MAETKKEFELSISFSSREDAEDIRDTLMEDLAQHGRDHSLITIKETPNDEPVDEVEVVIDLESLSVMVPKGSTGEEIRLLVNQKLEQKIAEQDISIDQWEFLNKERETEGEN